MEIGPFQSNGKLAVLTKIQPFCLKNAWIVTSLCLISRVLGNLILSDFADVFFASLKEQIFKGS